MILKAIKTAIVTNNNSGLDAFLDKYIPPLKEKSIVVLTSKVLSIFEKRYIKKNAVDKKSLIKKESDYYYPHPNKEWNIVLTIKNNILIPSAGIDESNGFGHYILWPKNPFNSALKIWKYLRKNFKIKQLGVIITDSKTTPLRWGTTGISIGYCGFEALKDYIGKPDIFNKKLRVTKANIADGLAAAAVAAMGEGAEQTPIIIIEDLKFVVFQDRPPTKKEINGFSIDLKKDLYYPVLSSIKWIPGGKK